MNYITDDPNASLTDGMHLLVDALKVNGVEAIFGVVGIPVTDLARYAQQAGIRYIGFRHEQSAGHAAAISGYLTKKPGIRRQTTLVKVLADRRQRTSRLQEAKGHS